MKNFFYCTHWANFSCHVNWFLTQELSILLNGFYLNASFLFPLEKYNRGWDEKTFRLFGSLAGFVFISLKESFVKMFLSTFKLMLMLQWISWSCQNYIFFLLFTNSQYKPFDRANKENSSNKRKNKECAVHKNTSNNLQYLQLQS